MLAAEAGVNGIDALSVSPPIAIGSTPAIASEVQKAAPKRSFEVRTIWIIKQHKILRLISLNNWCLFEDDKHKSARADAHCPVLYECWADINIDELVPLIRV